MKSTRRRSSLGAAATLLVWVAIFAPPGNSQQQDSVDKATLQSLLDRVAQLEARVQQLESNRTIQPGAAESCQSPSAPTAAPSGLQTASTPGNPPSPSSNVAQKAPETDSMQSEPMANERMDVSKTLLRIRGFGDVSFHGDNQHGDATSFSLGQLDLFVTSDLSERYRFLTEIVFEAGPDNIYGSPIGSENQFGVDLERYLIQYSRNEHLNLSLGRGHTAIGYYNTAYHHSAWMQTTVDRPFLFQFEDRGGILPIHMVGASATGLVTSSKLGLHYIAEIGNGRESRDPLQDEPVQNVKSDQNHKAFDLGAFLRPEGMPGFQAGLSLYKDQLVPSSQPKISETIIAAHAILIRPKYEWLSEALLDTHTPVGSATVFHTAGGYAQLSRQFGQFRPYFRYEYLNAPVHEPVFPDVGLRHGPLAGIRFDPNESVALKLQFNQTFLRNQPSVSGLTGQVGFTF